MSSSFLDAVKERIIVFDGAMGTNVQNHNLTEADFGGLEGCNEFWLIPDPMSFSQSIAHSLKLDATLSRRILLVQHLWFSPNMTYLNALMN